LQTQELGYENGVNLPELLARIDNDSEFLIEVFELFQGEFPKLLLLLRDAVQLSDLEQVQNAAHTLSGMLSGLSMSVASAAAMRIERMARQGTPVGIYEELAVLESSVAMAESYLDKVCRELTG
jgi:HPt (histidine-containing phosphotransfer) domain-containing protein